MIVKVVVPTYNASLYIKGQLKLLKDQTLKPSEILVIDSASSDGTRDIALSLGARVVVIKKEEFSHGRTRNMALHLLDNTDVVVFMSQDAIPKDRFLIEKLVKVLEGKVVASYARHVPREDAKPTEFAYRLFNYPDKEMEKGKELVRKLGIRTFFFSNVCSAIRFDIFKEVGGFPEDVAVAEDLVFAAKLVKEGYRIAYVPEACVYHSHNFGPIYYFRRYFDLGRSLRNYYWIVSNNHIGDHSRGILKEQLKFILKNRKILWIPYWILEGFLKFLGFHVGLRSHILPKNLVNFISLYPDLAEKTPLN